MRKEAEAWLKIAGEDLKSAEVLFTQRLFRMACCHAQQSIEKILKALLCHHEIDIPRTHNLLDLNNASKKCGRRVFSRLPLVRGMKKYCSAPDAGQLPVFGAGSALLLPASRTAAFRETVPASASFFTRVAVFPFRSSR